jgi:ribosomal protein RSM22 (predicted rRNA methylase)
MFSKLTPETCRALAGIGRLIDEIEPVPARFHREMTRNIRDLSALLTHNRRSLTGTYLSDPACFSAYLRYFLPWNLFRLCKLFSGFDALAGTLAAQTPTPVVTDLGSGPLTLPIALWIALPALRERPLEFQCFDINKRMLKTGERLFYEIARKTTGPRAVNWKIKTICASLTQARVEQKAALVTAVNVYNELFWKLGATDERAHALFADNEAARLAALCGPDGAALIVEPGIPRCGEFITRLRAALITKGFSMKAPCTHEADCPLHTSKIQDRAAKWCHFTFPVSEAPQTLHNLSRAARLSKERGMLTFLLAQKGSAQAARPPRGAAPIRVISNAFPLPDHTYARYGCNERGLVLLKGSRSALDRQSSGSVIHGNTAGGESRDKKSGALIVKLDERPAP